MAADRRRMEAPARERIDPQMPVGQGFAVSLDRVSKAYRELRVLDGISLEAGAGECLALLGPNGAGKTTLFKLILGLVRPDKGEVKIGGVRPGAHDFRALRAQSGFLPENVSFYDAMLGGEVLNFYASLKGATSRECDVLLDRVGLAAAASRRVATYSKGMRQRLGLAQALLGQPRLLILDEPTTGLDASLRRTFFDILQTFREAGVTIIISSHALTEIEARADRYAILEGGRLAAVGTLSELQRRSGLPVRIRLKVARGNMRVLRETVGTRGSLVPTGDGRVDLTCAPDRKVLLLREILASGVELLDIESRSSSLEDVYAHFATDKGER